MIVDNRSLTIDRPLRNILAEQATVSRLGTE